MSGSLGGNHFGDIARNMAAQQRQREQEWADTSRAIDAMHERKEQLRVEEVEREQRLVELTQVNADQIGRLADLMRDQHQLSEEQRDLAAEQHEENRRLSLLTNVVSLAVILQVLLMIFEPDRISTKLLVALGALTIAGGLAWVGRLLAARRKRTA